MKPFDVVLLTLTILLTIVVIFLVYKLVVGRYKLYTLLTSPEKFWVHTYLTVKGIMLTKEKPYWSVLIQVKLDISYLESLVFIDRAKSEDMEFFKNYKK